MMQAASDIYLELGLKGLDVRRHFYWRQLRDMKGSALVEDMIPLGLTFYARICGWTLARAHARSGDPVAIAAYLGDSDAFDKSITDFSQRYADQNERDYQEFANAVESGWLKAGTRAFDDPVGLDASAAATLIVPAEVTLPSGCHVAAPRYFIHDPIHHLYDVTGVRYGGPAT